MISSIALALALCAAPLTEAARTEEFRMAHQTPKEPGDEGSGQMIALPGGSKAYLCRPKAKARGGVLVIHEWWGLNHNIKGQAEKLASLGYTALAVDLYGGKTAKDAEEAGRMMEAVRPDAALAVLKAAVKYMRTDPEIKVAKLGTVGWCFGGGWSLKCAVAAGKDVDACVVYYGEVPSDPAKLEGLASPVLGVFATRDKWITPKVAADFDRAMKVAGKALVKADFPADHAFANPSSPNSDQSAARAAWDKTLAFFAQHLK